MNTMNNTADTSHNKVGRPTKWDPIFLDRVDDYIKECGGNQMKLPTRYGFSKFIEVDTDTLVEWDKLYTAFSVALKKIDCEQQEQLMNDGMYGGKEVNSTMAIFLLKVNHGMIETSHTDITTGGEKLAPNVTINTTDH